jgi:hypothetical protein
LWRIRFGAPLIWAFQLNTRADDLVSLLYQGMWDVLVGCLEGAKDSAILTTQGMNIFIARRAEQRRSGEAN